MCENKQISESGQNTGQDAIVYLPIYKVEPNRQQPRKLFDEQKILELADSIAKYGILEPIIVSKENDYYSIIAGERRWRASVKAGLKKVPVIIKNLTEKEKAEIALIENIQREDLNPIEKATAFKKYCEDFHVTQYELADAFSIARASITNTMRLLGLPEDVKKLIVDGELSAGHGRAILKFKNPLDQKLAAEKVIRENLSVRETETMTSADLVKSAVKRKKPKKKVLETSSNDTYIEDSLKNELGTKVAIRREQNRGVLCIDFYSEDDLEELYEKLISG